TAPYAAPEPPRSGSAPSLRGRNRALRRRASHTRAGGLRPGRSRASRIVGSSSLGSVAPAPPGATRATLPHAMPWLQDQALDPPYDFFSAGAALPAFLGFGWAILSFISLKSKPLKVGLSGLWHFLQLSSSGCVTMVSAAPQVSP